MQGVAEDAQATLDSLAKNGRGLPPTVIMDRLKNNLRKLGYRCQVTLQVLCMHICPSASSPSPFLPETRRRFYETLMLHTRLEGRIRSNILFVVDVPVSIRALTFPNSDAASHYVNSSNHD